MRLKWQAKWLKLEARHPRLNELAKVAHDFCADAFNRPAAGRLLVIYGGSGNGKTHVARAICRWFNAVHMNMKPQLNDEGIMTQPGAAFANWAEVVDGFKKGNWLRVDDLASEFLTVIDDIGAEHDPSRIGVEKLYLILNQRQRRYTVITTNHGPGEWEEKFERRIASRLFRNSTLIDLSEVPDYGTRL